ncbi:MAG: hypothetical protein EXR98_19785 [Gemmataceae bacterium]|nr:hypothetical protein [Gemmataceae bacterium]
MNNLKPTAICHGIESLACKLEYSVDPQDPSERSLGRRAFGRDHEGAVWSFQRLRQPSNYVRNTHRQAATRSIRQDGGLGFATGVRFDLLALEPVGRALADAFLKHRVGKGGTSLHNWLLRWLRGERDLPDWSDTLHKALSPEHPTADERNLVRSRVFETSTSSSEKRQRLARAIGRQAEFPDIERGVIPRLRDAGHRKQADEVIAARAFGAMLDRARDATSELTRAVEPGRGGVPLATLVRDVALQKALATLRAATANFSSKASAAGINEPTSRTFAAALLAATNEEQAIRLLVESVGKVLNLAEAAVIRGALFRVVDNSESLDGVEEGAVSIEPDRTGRTFRVANLHSLLRDTGHRGAA